MLDGIKLWLRQFWAQAAAAAGLAFILWLRFFHDPEQRKEATLQVQRKELRRRLEAYEKSEKDSSAEEERLKERIAETDIQLERIRSERVSDDDAADAIAGWIGRRRRGANEGGEG